MPVALFDLAVPTVVREALSEERRKEMGEAFIQLEIASTRPHPQTPQTPEVRAAAGPLAGLFNRMRDKHAN